MPKNRIPGDLQVWIDARKRFHLSHAHVQMARELGMNPNGFGKLANHKQEPWKLPLPQFIERLYHTRFGKECPDVVVSIEERARRTAAKKAARREAKRSVEKQTPVIAWYLEEHWDKLREISADKDSLQHTYAEWLVNAKNAQRQAAAAGVNIETVIVHVDELQAWCRSQGCVINRKSRSRFVAHLLRSRAGQKELAANNPSPEQETAPAEEEVRNPPSY